MTLRFPIAAALAMLALSCGGQPPPPAAEPAAPKTSESPVASAAPPEDPLGPRPMPGAPPAFTPPSPQILEGPAHSRLWLLERHGLPLVTIAVVVPYGSASEQPEKAGLSFVTADMLDEGTKDRDALAFSQAIHDLGARLSSSADRDASVVSLEVLTSKLDQALPLLAEAITRPRHDPKDFARVKALWINSLKSRAQEPNEVARVVTAAAFYGPKHPYGHAPDGTLATAAKIDLGDISRWHHTIWRPEAATFVVVGDLKADAAKALLEKSFAGWRAQPGAALAPVAPAPPPVPKGVVTYVVDRADAPQVVMSIARSGPPVADPAYPRLDMLNIALGGSFTSRLNQNLREDHGWSYGVRSRFNAQRGAGMFVVRAAIRADAITPALHEALGEVTKMQKQGLTADELTKLRALVEGGALETYSTVHSVAGTLAGNAALALSPDQELKNLEAQRNATAADLGDLASKYLDLASGIVVLVGPKELAKSALAENGLPAPQLVDADGRPAETHPADAH
jgi:zinc protease